MFCLDDQERRVVAGLPPAPRRGLSQPMHFRDLRPVELTHPVAPKLFQLAQTPFAFAYEAGYVYPERLGLEFFEAGDTALQEAGGAAPVAVLLVVETDADLEDALVEVADLLGFFSPGVLQVLVALVELTPVEILYALEDEVGDPFEAPLRTLFSRSNPRRNSRHRRRWLCGRSSWGWSRGPSRPG